MRPLKVEKLPSIGAQKKCSMPAWNRYEAPVWVAGGLWNSSSRDRFFETPDNFHILQAGTKRVRNTSCRDRDGILFVFVPGA